MLPLQSSFVFLYFLPLFQGKSRPGAKALILRREPASDLLPPLVAKIEEVARFFAFCPQAYRQ